MAHCNKLNFSMLVKDSQINGSLYSWGTAHISFRIGAAFSSLNVSSVPSVVPIMIIIHRTTEDIVNSSLPK